MTSLSDRICLHEEEDVPPWPACQHRGYHVQSILHTSNSVNLEDLFFFLTAENAALNNLCQDELGQEEY